MSPHRAEEASHHIQTHHQTVSMYYLQHHMHRTVPFLCLFLSLTHIIFLTLSLLLSNFPPSLHLISISTSRAISYVSSSPIPSSSPSFPLRSFEAEMFERASKKLGLEQAVLGTRQFNDNDVRCCNGDASAFRSWPLILIQTASCTVFSTFSSWNVYLHMLLFQHTHICARSIPPSFVIASSTPFTHPFFHTVLLTYHSSILFSLFRRSKIRRAWKWTQRKWNSCSEKYVLRIYTALYCTALHFTELCYTVLYDTIIY